MVCDVVEVLEAKAIQFNVIFSRLEVVDRVVAVGRGEDKRVRACLGGWVNFGGITPHLIVACSTEQCVIPTFGMVEELSTVAVHLCGAGYGNNPVVTTLGVAAQCYGVAQCGKAAACTAQDVVIATHGVIGNRNRVADKVGSSEP